MQVRHPAALAFAVFVSSACSSVSPTQACTDLSTAICSKASQCAAPLLGEIYGDEATCATRTDMACQSALALKNTGDTPDDADKCSKAYATLSCADFFDNNPPIDCKPKTPGKLTNGTACGNGGQCASTICQIDPTTGCGTCIDAVASGQACKSASDCQAGLVCAATSSTAAVCIAPAASGATCSTALPIVPCAAGLLCNATGKCQAPLPAGSACDPKASLCDGANGYWCTPRGTRCTLVLFANAGQPCGYDAKTGDLTGCLGSGAGAGLIGNCGNVSQTTFMGTCVGAAADGAACDATNGPFCEPPALCINKTCTVVDPSSCH